MKGTFSLIMSLALVISMFTVSVFAEEYTTEKNEQSLQKGTDSGLETTFEEIVYEAAGIVKDFSKKTVTTGVHTVIRIPYYQDGLTYIPTFTLVHRTKTGKDISLIEIGPKQFDRETGEYHVIFKNPGFKLGEEYQIYLSKADSSVNELSLEERYFQGDNLIYNTTKLKVGNYASFKVRKVEYSEGEYSEIGVLDLQPSEYFPIRGDLITDSSKIAIKLQNEAGVPLKNEKVILKFTNDKKMSVTSDNTGIAWVDKKDITQEFQIYSETRDG
ncbi:hypothetical protein QNH10_19750 [Sporosarcina thermotolerans]|uniref:hypothetical protein n=1 Tax=Sporosarcina thermotolerans TaxID=633404 RepID=UPI0024BC9EF1|nr:hypothetical protein [Sporosarcina thermotolerans]WHT48222.1 hypothetical protein QNH10_19750 [Sporosarcina thermotolerans]